ncbi:MAG: hypothetical protein ABI222_14785 [Opitutaceae bacterium]
MSTGVIRILSDLHYGDRGSRLRTLPSLAPLFEGASSLVLNGDSLDTRPGPDPVRTAQLRADLLGFFARSAPPTTILTGNHDPDISPEHSLDLADGQVFVMHGDIIFDDMVPWGQDAAVARQRLNKEFAARPAGTTETLAERFAIYRRVAASIPQRHQSEQNSFKYTLSFVADTIWPPNRVMRVLSAWRRAPRLAASLTQRFRPSARFAIIGHVHHPGFWRRPDGLVILNTGSFCPPSGGCAIDVGTDRLTLRRIVEHRGGFHFGKTMAEFALAPT